MIDIEKVVERLVDEATRIAMFDFDWRDESIPEIKSARSEFREAFKKVLMKGKLTK